MIIFFTDTETGTCSIDTVARCIYGNSDGNTFGLTSTISDRNTICRYVIFGYTMYIVQIRL